MSNNTAFWISPEGNIADVGMTHIEGVFANPEKFGVDRDYLNKVYAKHDEKLFSEGKAREEIIRGLVERGFIRIRKHGNQGYFVNVWRIAGRVPNTLKHWAQGMLGILSARGFFGHKDPDTHAVVAVVPLNSDEVFRTTLGQLAAYGTRSEGKDEEGIVLRELQMADWPSRPVGADKVVLIEKRLIGMGS